MAQKTPKSSDSDNGSVFFDQRSFGKDSSPTKTNKRNISKSKLREYRDAFSLFDKDQNGFLTKEELGHVMHQLGQWARMEELQDMLAEVDTDGDGNVSFEEFVEILLNITDSDQDSSAAQEEQELRDAFKVFDKHNRGYITSSDLRAVLQCLGEDLDEDEITSCQDYSISQISPKSQIYDSGHENIQPSMAVNFEHEDAHKENEESSHHSRVERSASPILNDGSTSGKLNHFDSNDVESSGRYYSSINPTTTQDNDGKLRTGKELMDEDSFLGEGGRRAKSSRPQSLTPSSVMPTELTATKQPSSPRQNSNPDIQDIITGIVKLLNGNVNVHANNGGTRRPNNNRINNRGPPRISEAQVPANDIQEPNKNPHQQSPYPFDRPEGPLRPFLTGVPLPEQIVPSMQQNYNRPGFVSQNRPPWKRPRPRPPINANRRPIPPYRPIPSLPEYKKPEEEQNLHQNLSDGNNGDKPVHELDVDGPIYDEISSEEEVSEKAPSKDELKKKKTEKKPISPDSIVPTPSVTTIIQTTSEVNTVQQLDNSFETLEVTEKPFTPSLESSIKELTSYSSEIIETPTLVKSSSVEKPTTITSSQVMSSSLQTPPLGDQKQTQFHPRPGLVLDDPEFQPGQKIPNNRPRLPPGKQKSNLPPGYGEIFDITLSAIQGPNGNTGSLQTLNIKPYGTYEGSDIILSPSGDQAFVSIDGKRSYINLFGDSTDAPIVSSSQVSTKPQIQPTGVQAPGVTGSGYVVAETEPTIKKPHQNRPVHRPRLPAQQPPVRIDTCIVGDDSTCDQAQHEKCKTENGVSSCHCRPGFARRKHREPCRKVVSVVVSLRVDKIYDRRVSWNQQLSEYTSEPYQQLSYESLRAIDSAMSMTPFSDEFMEAKVNNIYQGNAAQGLAGVFVNLTLMIEENGETTRPALKGDIQRHLLGVIHRRNNNIGNSALFVESPPGSVSNIQDLDECLSQDLNDCHPEAACSNIWGGFRCECSSGFKDPFSDQPHRAGRECLTCSDTFCNNRGSCSYDAVGNQACACIGTYYGTTCEVDGEVLAVAVGASVAAIIIIILTLICLVMWSRRWQNEHKNAMVGSPVFGYLGGGQVKTPAMGTAPYQVTLEDRMRWAQIADVMAQSNHYGVEPVAATRPSSAMFQGYPHLQTISGMSTLGAMSMGGMTMHTNGTLPPVPMPRNYRLGLNRPSGMRTLENSSSSEEEDRTDLLGRNFQVPRPKSRSNASVTSGIYYDVDYLPSGEQHLYGTANNHNGSQMQMSTYTPGRAPSTTYYK